MNFIEMAIAVLRRTNDGEDLHPLHLYLLREGFNGHLTDDGIQFFTDEIYTPVMAGEYQAPWFHGIEGLTIIHNGSVLWRGERVEHYDSLWCRSDEAKRAAAALVDKLTADGGQ